MFSTAWPFYPLAFLQDSARCLALISQTHLRLNPQGYLQPASLSRLAGVMALRPNNAEQLASEAQAPGLSFLLRLLGCAGLTGVVEGSLRLSSTAYEWLDQPAETQLLQLRQVWWSRFVLEAGNLPPLAFPRFLERRWPPLCLEICRWAARLPTEKWTASDDLQAYLAKHHLLEPVGHTRSLPNVRRVAERRALALAEFLIKLALPYLGLIELECTSANSGFRPTPEGSAWLRAALSHHTETALSPASAAELAIHSPQLVLPRLDEPLITVNDDLSLALHPAAPAACAFEIAHLAQLVSLDAACAVYQLSRQSVKQAIGWGYPLTDITFLLARYSGGRLPSAVVAQLSRWQEELVAITCEPGYSLRAASPVILKTLRQRQPFRSRTSLLASGQEAWVSLAQAQDLFRYLRRLGYSLTPVPSPSGREGSGVREWVRVPLPLVQMLVLVRTYQHLRQRLPGLADLGLEDIEQDINLALSAKERAAVQRLVESHVALLEQVGQEGSRPGDMDIEAHDSGQETKAREEGPPVTDACGASAGRLRASASPTLVEQARHLATRLQAAIESGASVDITYADTKGNITHRRVHPLRLEQHHEQDYLVACCELRHDCKQSERHFRLDRIVEWKVESDM